MNDDSGKKFSAGSTFPITGLSIVGLIMLFEALANPAVINKLERITFLIVGLVAVFVVFRLGTYGKVVDNHLIYSNIFLERKKTKIENIFEISTHPSFILFKGSIKSIVVFYRNDSGSIKQMEFRLAAYTEKTLASLVQELRQRNSRIELDEATKALASKYSSDTV